MIQMLSYQRGNVKIFVWFNILLQILSPLFLWFTPTVIARANPLISTIQTQPYTIQTQPYILQTGETPILVAKRLGISIDELKKANQFRIFDKTFEQLGPGDEIDLPESTIFSPTINSPETEKTVASVLNRAGSMLQSEASLSSQAASMVTGAAIQAGQKNAEKWLSRFGTARIQFNLDHDLSLGGSSLDMLAPIYESSGSMFFTQFGIRGKDDRTTANLGGGVRMVSGENWMLGGNIFLDNDFTGENRRIGLGVEAWTNYLKLSANQYIGLSDWQQSHDFEDYNERPADGYDIRADGWLPSYPQLGIKFIYEKYKGDEVALFGEEDRLKDPYAITTGFNWTPFPLITAGIDHRAGKSGQNDTQVSLTFNWQPDVSWEKQTTSENVKQIRALSGSTYDLVERNNNIVLEYQKQQLINLSLPHGLNGESGSELTVQALVQAKYGIDKVVWDAPALLAAGGELEEISPTRAKLTLPSYKTQQSGVTPQPNIYTVGAIAHDVKGNTSSHITTDVGVTPAHTVLKPLQISGNNAVADGNAIVQVTATVINPQNQQPVPGQRVVFSSPDNLVTVAVPSGGVGETNAHGQVIANVVSTRSGTYTLMAHLDDGSEQQISLSFIAGDVNADSSSFTSSKDEIKANGLENTTLTLVAKDSDNNPVTGLSTTRSANLSFNIQGIPDNGYVLSALKETSPGEYKSTLSGTQVGTVIARPVVDGTQLGDLKADVRLIGGAVDAGQSEFIGLVPASIIADNAMSSTLTVMLKDAQGNGLSGEAAGMQTVVTGVEGTTVSAFAENSIGIYTATIKGKHAGVATLSVKVGNISLNQSHSLTLLPDPVTANVVAFTASPPSAIAGQPVVLTAVVEDANGNRIEGNEVRFTVATSSSGNAHLSAPTGLTNQQGEAQVTLTDTSAEEVNLTAQTSGGIQKSLKVVFSASVDGATVISLDADQVGPINNDNTYMLTAVLHNNQGIPLAGQEVRFAITPNDESFIVTPVNGGFTNESGIATATLSSTTVGAVTVTATGPNGSDPGQTIRRSFTAGAVSESTSTIAVDLNTIPAAGTTRVYTTLKDQHSNPVTGLTNVTFQVASAHGASTGSTTEEGNGVYSAILRAGGTTERLTVNPVVGGHVLESVSVSVTVNAGAVVDGTITTDAISGNLVANNSTTVVTFEALDAYNNPVPGLADEMTFEITHIEGATTASIITPITETLIPGTYVATLNSGTVAGTISIAPYISGFSVANVTPTSLALTADPATATPTLNITTNNSPADGQTPNEVQVTVRDFNGNLVKNATVNWGAVGAVTTPSTGITSDDGTTTTSVTSVSEGVIPVTATLTLNGANDSINTNFIGPAQPQPYTGTITANNYTFQSSSGFPTQMLANMFFTLNLSAPEEYEWTTDKTWLEVSPGGIATVRNDPGRDMSITTITMRKKDNSITYEYKFTPSRWYQTTLQYSNLSNAIQNCQGLSLVLPAAASLVSGSRAVGSLIGEWGDLTRYPNLGSASWAWTNDPDSQYPDTKQLTVNLSNGTTAGVTPDRDDIVQWICANSQ